MVKLMYYSLITFYPMKSKLSLVLSQSRAQLNTCYGSQDQRDGTYPQARSPHAVMEEARWYQMPVGVAWASRRHTD